MAQCFSARVDMSEIRSLLLVKRCLDGVGILGICIPICRRFMSVLDVWRVGTVLLPRYPSSRCLMMV